MALLLLDTDRWSEGEGRDKCFSPCVKREGSDFLQTAHRHGVNTWQVMGRAEGKKGEKEGSPFMAASSEMQGECQCMSKPGGEEWM